MEADSLGCVRCGVGWQLIGGVLICPQCKRVSPFQPIPSQAEALQKLEELLNICEELCEEEINLNDFKVLISNLVPPSS